MKNIAYFKAVRSSTYSIERLLLLSLLWFPLLISAENQLTIPAGLATYSDLVDCQNDTIAPTPNYTTGVLTFPLMIPACEDHGPPFIYIRADDFNIDSEDDCTPKEALRFSFSVDVEDDTLYRTAADYTGLVEELTIYVWDEAGNFRTSEVDILVIGEYINSIDAAGKIVTPEGEAIHQVEVNIRSVNNGVSNSLYTDTAGEFWIESLDFCGDYVFRPEKISHPLNGVSTFDLLLISRHILGLDSLDAPYQYFAADVNRSGTITTFDLVELRRLILGIDDDFRNHTSWAFAAESWLPNQNAPLDDLPVDSIPVDGLTFGNNTINYIGWKVGDVSGNANPQMLVAQASEERHREKGPVLSLPDQLLRAGQRYTIPISLSSAKDLLGLQFDLAFDREKVLVEEVLGSRVADAFLHYCENHIHLAWWDATLGNDLLRSDSAQVLFHLVLRPLVDTPLSGICQLAEKRILAEAYPKNLLTSSSQTFLAIDLQFENQGWVDDHIEDLDFVGVKVGDISGNLGFSLNTQASDRQDIQNWNIYLGDQWLEAGQQYRIPVYAAPLEEYFGFQFSLNYDPENVAIQKIELDGENLLQNTDFVQHFDKISVSWHKNENNYQKLEPKQGNYLFTLQLSVLNSTRLSTVFHLNNGLAPEAYSNKLLANPRSHPDKVSIQYNKGIDRAISQKAKTSFDLFQNQPNPFRQKTRIAFDLPKVSKV
ncbi:MAG: hypothetical protein AAFP19_25220, partial [Bacteroidota bacterium]